MLTPGQLVEKAKDYDDLPGDVAEIAQLPEDERFAYLWELSTLNEATALYVLRRVPMSPIHTRAVFERGLIFADVSSSRWWIELAVVHRTPFDSNWLRGTALPPAVRGARFVEVTPRPVVTASSCWRIELPCGVVLNSGELPKPGPVMARFMAVVWVQRLASALSLNSSKTGPKSTPVAENFPGMTANTSLPQLRNSLKRFFVV